MTDSEGALFIDPESLWCPQCMEVEDEFWGAHLGHVISFKKVRNPKRPGMQFLQCADGEWHLVSLFAHMDSFCAVDVDRCPWCGRELPFARGKDVADELG